MALEYCGIRVTDLDRSLKFYTGALGLRELRRGTMEHGGLFILLEDPETSQRLELNFYPPNNRFWTPFSQGEGLDHLGFKVKDARATLARLLAEGATAAVEPWEESGYVIGFVKDPDGHWIEVYDTGP